MSTSDEKTSRGNQPGQPDRLPRELRRGSISWMARNPVAANLLMALLLVGGLVFGLQIKQEVFPEFDTDLVRVVVPYPGASPKEVESGIVMAVEEAVRGLDGVKRVTARAAEGAGTVTVELLLGTEGNKALTDIKNAIDRIKTFPQDAEQPTVELVSSRREVISLAGGETDFVPTMIRCSCVTFEMCQQSSCQAFSRVSAAGEPAFAIRRLRDLRRLLRASWVRYSELAPE